MNKFDLYDDIALNLPPIDSNQHEMDWVLIHDGNNLRENTLKDVLAKFSDFSDIYIIVHSNPGIAKKIKFENVIESISKYILNTEIQISDLKFSTFVSILKIGVAASCKY
jgi:hypothetical protein